MDIRAVTGRLLAGVLAVVFAFDLLVLVVLSTRSTEGLPGVAASALVLACVGVAWRHPLPGAVAASAVVVGVSLVPSTEYLTIETVGALTMTEFAAGGALVFILVSRLEPRTALGWSAFVAGSGALAAALRHSVTERSLVSGALVVLIAVGLGVAVRTARPAGSAGPGQDFLRAGWAPVTVMAVLFLVDTGQGLLTFRGSVGVVYALLWVAVTTSTAVFALLAPRAAVRWTMAAAALTVLGGTAWSALDSMGMSWGWSPPLPVTLVGGHMALVATVIRYAERRWALYSVGALVVADLATLVEVDPDGLPMLLLLSAFLLVVAAATGQYFRSRDRERDQTVRTAVTGAQQTERMALARELHDVVAHHVTGIVVQAQAARLVAEKNPAAVAVALGRIEASGTEALTAMRTLVGSLRTAAQPWTAGAQATTDLAADLRSLTANFAGPTVDLDLDLPGALPQETGRSVLRLVQESLTNVTKHAPGARTVRVRITTTEHDLLVRVADDGADATPRPQREPGGYGLIGMRERVELLGGTFAAGPGSGPGWTVEARLPLRQDR